MTLRKTILTNNFKKSNTLKRIINTVAAAVGVLFLSIQEKNTIKKIITN